VGRYDPIKLEVFKNLLASVAEEMGVALCRTGHSPNIKERRDYSCAIFDGGGEMIAQAAHIPVHLGSMPLAVKGAMEGRHVGPGDTIIQRGAPHSARPVGADVSEMFNLTGHGMKSSTLRRRSSTRDPVRRRGRRSGVARASFD